MNKEKCNAEDENNDDLLELWPHHLLCMLCMNGGAFLPFMKEHCLKEKLDKIKSNPDIHIRLVTSFDEIGVQTDTFYEQTPIERKKDLNVLQKLGLVPNDIRTARVLLSRINENINDLQGICATGFTHAAAWSDCPSCDAGYFNEGKRNIIKPVNSIERIKAKEDSAKMINDADHLFVRAHHLLCILCSLGVNIDKPNEANNIYELLQKMIANPDIPITIVEGCSQCMVCKPCSNFNAEKSICVSLSGLRDRLKDLTVFQELGLNPGDTIAAKQIYKMIAEKIPDTSGICKYEKMTSPEWKNCMTKGAYEMGVSRIKNIYKLEMF